MIFKKDFFKKHEVWLISGFFLLAIFSFLYSSGTLFSGYHFIDDHCVISMKEALEKNSFLKTAYLFVKGDFNIRFRPFFYLYYVSLTKLFGLNFLAWSIFVGVLAVIIFVFFYQGARKLGYFWWEALFLIGLTFVGTQSAVWWKLGVNEPIGLLFLGLSFFFLASCLNSSEKKYFLNNFGFLVALAGASLCKENFIFVIPAFVFYKIFKEKAFFKIGWREILKKNQASFWLLVLMLAELVIIKFFVGTNKIGYAGTTASWNEFVMGVKNIFFLPHSLGLWMDFLKKIGWLYLIFLMADFWEKRDKKRLLLFFKEFFFYFSFSVLIVLSNVFVYAKSGMAERYLLPTTFGLAFLAVNFWKSVENKGIKIVMGLAILSFLGTQFNFAKANAQIFAIEGKNANYLFDKIRKTTHRSDDILLVVDPVKRYEVSDSIRIYLNYYGFKNFYVYPILADYQSEFENRLKNEWLSWFENKQLKDLQTLPQTIIIFDSVDKGRFFIESGMKESDYQTVSDGKYPFLILIRKQEK